MKLKKEIPLRLIAGIFLVIIFWYINWNTHGLRTHWGFFPLWLGFALSIDGLVYIRKGSSLFSRNKLAYIGLFLISIPIWWLFELFNQLTENWKYLGREYFSDLEYFLLASLSFSTVIPSVFGSAELLSTFLKDTRKKFLIEQTPKNGFLFLAIGSMMLLLLIIFPKVFYVFIWMTVFFFAESINAFMKNKSLLFYTSRGNWRPVFSLALGCLICGFFWEFWNYYSYPKWIYDVPGVNFLHIFEMPLLGYLGYIPFSFELFAIYVLFVNLIGKSELENYIEL